MKYTLEVQTGYVTEPIRARFAMIIPILRGMLFSTKRNIVEQAGGHEKITFEMFCRIYIENPGDYGICFEYALHNSIRGRDSSIYDKISYVLDTFCKIGPNVESILFGAEKSGAQSIIESTKSILTDNSKLLPGTQAPPTFLKRHLNNIALAMRSTSAALSLPASIRGVWKADLFLGNSDTDYWVATTLKTNRVQIEEAPGLRIAIYPESRRNEEPRMIGSLIHCPLPYNIDFMQLFGATFQIVKQLIAAHGKQPHPAALVYFDDQEVAKWLADRAHFPVLDILDALENIKQVDLLSETGQEETSSPSDVIAAAPIPLIS
jgi:hypothetical protein